MPKPKKVTVKTIEKPITVSLKVNDSVKEIRTDNVLASLRSLEVDPRFVKTLTQFTVQYQGHTFYQSYKIPFMRALLQSDLRRQLFAKKINLALGIIVDNYN